MTIAVDFDGTIVTHAYPEIGRERTGAIDTLRRLQADGHMLILWTVREGDLLQDAVDYCRCRGLEFHAVNENYSGEKAPDEAAAGCRKLTADVYIDDRNLGGFPGWEAVYAMIAGKQTFARYYHRLHNEATPRPRQNFWHRLFGHI